jgi:hypothetical protein
MLLLTLFVVELSPGAMDCAPTKDCAYRIVVSVGGLGLLCSRGGYKKSRREAGFFIGEED